MSGCALQPNMPPDPFWRLQHKYRASHGKPPQDHIKVRCTTAAPETVQMPSRALGSSPRSRWRSPRLFRRRPGSWRSCGGFSGPALPVPSTGSPASLSNCHSPAWDSDKFINRKVSSIGRFQGNPNLHSFERMENRKVSLKTPSSYSILANIGYLMAVRTSWYSSLLKWQLSWCQNPQISIFADQNLGSRPSFHC